MRSFDPARVMARANADGEFLLAARFWTAAVGLEVGEERYLLRLEDGRVAAFEAAPEAQAADVRVAAPAEAWHELLAPVPRPFYHDLFAASARSGFTLQAGVDGLAYYPALRRLVEIMREVAA